MMSNPVNQLHALLRQHQFRLERQERHYIYKNPEGKIFIVPATPSDTRWARNAISDLKRVIANPSQPLTLAISDFERKQAAQLIQGQQKLQHAAHGMGSSKQKHSRGTGFIYNDAKVLTVEEIAQREQARGRALAAKEARRQRKLAHRAEQVALAQERRAEAERKAAERRAAEEKRLEPIRPFIDLMKYSVTKFYELSIRRWQWAQHPRPWDAESNFFEYPFRSLEEVQFVRNYNKEFQGLSLMEVDKDMALQKSESVKFQPPSLKRFTETVEELVVENDGSLSHVADGLSDLLTDEPRSDQAAFAQEVHELVLLLVESLEGCLENFAHDKNIVEPDSDDFVILASGDRFVVFNAEDEERADALEFPQQNNLNLHIHRVWLGEHVGTEEFHIYHGGFPLTAIPEYAASVADEEEEEETEAA